MFDEDAKVKIEIKHLQKQMKKSPLLFARLGECYIQLGDWEKAEKILSSGIEDYPDYVSGLMILGESYLLNGFHSDAEECAIKGLDKDPTHLGLLRLMEKIKKQTEEIDELEKVRERITSIDPLMIPEVISKPAREPAVIAQREEPEGKQETLSSEIGSDQKVVDKETADIALPEPDKDTEVPAETDKLEEKIEVTDQKAGDEETVDITPAESDKNTEPPIEADKLEDEIEAELLSSTDEILAEDDIDAADIDKLINEVTASTNSLNEEGSKSPSTAEGVTEPEEVDALEPGSEKAESDKEPEDESAVDSPPTEDEKEVSSVDVDETEKIIKELTNNGQVETTEELDKIKETETDKVKKAKTKDVPPISEEAVEKPQAPSKVSDSESEDAEVIAEAKEIADAEKVEDDEDPFGLDAKPDDNQTEETSQTIETTQTDEILNDSVKEETSQADVESDENLDKIDEVTAESKRPKKKIATKTLGELYATQKKFDEAIEIYQKLLETDPDNESYQERLADLESRRDNAVSEKME
ncbi:hypothetical protein CEE37_04715 [candidate division LCP-89 bacterium B3_LCP]|uniref:Tetratricopeptide repeat protein n=1 Tax=candidate division LCP-89 bacterium B3_LCP TaxID=2012998 RepID=A0A532V3V8_UNCL8|nr:MAG: hypothetical protein CEE37_04715 [candidate division LCP-89 bacterium B3_LCP]